MVIKRIEKIVKSNPSEIAYVVNNCNITYKKLWDEANEHSKYLVKEGNSPVVIYGDKDVSVFISIIACLIAGRTYVPVGLCTPLDRLKKIVALTNASLVLTDEDITIDDINCVSLNNLSKFARENNKLQKSDIAYIIFTSGSTGEPKGVPISNENLDNFVNWISKLYPLNTYKATKVFNQASFSFDLSVADIYYSLCNGHTLVAFDGSIECNYDDIFNIFAINHIEVCVITPTFAKLLLLNKKFSSDNYPWLKCIYFCGELLEPKIVKKIFERFPDINVINAYGPTEATSAVSGICINKKMLECENVLPVGDMNNNAVNIFIDAGEIVLSGKSVFSGYLGNYVGGHFKENGVNCYKTGDLGYIKSDKLYCCGRIDSQVKYKGYRIELDDIENNIKNILGVLDCAVVAKYDNEHLVKAIKAFVVMDDQQYANTSYLMFELAKLIPRYMLPKTIIFLDKLPINKNGKIDRKALSEL